MSTKPLNPNAEPYYLKHQRLPFPAPAAVVLSQYVRHFHPYTPYDSCAPGFMLFPPNHHFVNQEALFKNAKENGMLRRGPASNKSKRCLEKKKVQGKWRVKEAKEKKLPENSGVAARRAVIPFPTTVEEAEITRTTTVMIRNVPNQFQLGDLLRVLDNHCVELNRAADDPADFSKFDFLYLPMDYRKHVFERKKSNLGYAFVNFTTASAAFKFYERFNGAEWDVITNRKVCEVSAAQYQGKENLVKIFGSKIFVCKSPGFLPLVFLAARNGFNRRSKGTPLGKHVWGLPKKSIGS